MFRTVTNYYPRVLLEECKYLAKTHCVQHVQIKVGNKFQLEQTILIFWTKFATKGYFWTKTEK